MTNQEKLDRAWELKQAADRIEKSVADEYRGQIIELSKEGKEREARQIIMSLNWHESIHKYDLVSLVREILG